MDLHRHTSCLALYSFLIAVLQASQVTQRKMKVSFNSDMETKQYQDLFSSLKANRSVLLATSMLFKCLYV